MVQSYQPVDSLIKAIDTVTSRYGISVFLSSTIFDSSDSFFKENLANLSLGSKVLFVKKKRTFKFGSSVFSMLIDSIKKASLCICNVNYDKKSVMIYTNLNAPMRQVVSDLIFAVPMAIVVHLPTVDGKLDQATADAITKEISTVFYDYSVQDVQEYADKIRSLYTGKEEANSE